MLEEAEEPEKWALIFETKLLSLLGYRPRLDRCVICSRLNDETKYYFSSHRGGTVCGGCRGGLSELIPISVGTARFLDAVASMEFSKMGRLIANPVVMRESTAALRNFVRYYTGRELKTRQFLDSIGGVDHEIRGRTGCQGRD